MTSPCRVWTIHQARCLLCDWSGELTGDAATAAEEARDHRAHPVHQRKLREAREAR